MDDFDAPEAPEAPQAFKTYPELLAGMGSAEKGRHEAKVAALATFDTLSLSIRMETATDPAMLWPIHQELASRGIPPILRGPRHCHGLQGDFLDFAADLQWLWQRYRYVMTPKYKLPRAIMKADPGSATWWELLKKLYSFKTTRNAAHAAIALNLDTDQRRHLRNIQTTTTRRLFFDLHDDRFGQLFDALKSEAEAKPDKAPADKRRTPTDIASRRARIFRTHVLLGGSLRDTARFWQKLSGETPSLATIHKSVSLAETAFKKLRAEWSKEKKAGYVSPPDSRSLTES